MPYRDEFDEPVTDASISNTLEAVRREVFLRTRGPAVAAGVLLAAALILAAVVFFAYPAGGDKDSAIPVIQADAQPFKVSPEEPGGMDIPHRDSTVFSSLRSSRQPQDGKAENLLAEDETAEDPLPRSQLFAGLNTDEEEAALNEIEPTAGTEELLNEGLAEEETLFGDDMETKEAEKEFAATKKDSVPQKVTLGAPVPLDEPGSPAPEDIIVISNPEPAPAPAPVAAKPEVKEEKVAALSETPKTDPVSTSPAAKGGYYVQVGSVSSSEAAERGWSGYQKEYSPLLTELDHRIERADLGAKGIYYRIQAGPIAKAEALEICASIKAKKPGGCLVVGP